MPEPAPLRLRAAAAGLDLLSVTPVMAGLQLRGRLRRSEQLTAAGAAAKRREGRHRHTVRQAARITAGRRRTFGAMVVGLTVVDVRTGVPAGRLSLVREETLMTAISRAALHLLGPSIDRFYDELEITSSRRPVDASPAQVPPADDVELRTNIPALVGCVLLPLLTLGELAPVPFTSRRQRFSQIVAGTMTVRDSPA